MNDAKIYFSLLGAFVFQLIALGTFGILFKEPFFTKSNLFIAIIATTMMSIFILRKRKKSKIL